MLPVQEAAAPIETDVFERLESNVQSYARSFPRVFDRARGSEIYAEQGVRIREARAEGGIPTRIRVPAGRPVTVGRAGEGTVIQVGAAVYTIARETDDVNL